MLRRPIVSRGVPVRRVVAATDVSAGEANAKVYPTASNLETLLAARRRTMRRTGRRRRDMGTRIRQIDA
jgi:hypothetical protein